MPVELAVTELNSAFNNLLKFPFLILSWDGDKVTIAIKVIENWAQSRITEIMLRQYYLIILIEFKQKYEYNKVLFNILLSNVGIPDMWATTMMIWSHHSTTHHELTIHVWVISRYPNQCLSQLGHTGPNFCVTLRSRCAMSMLCKNAIASTISLMMAAASE